ncbi:hypothetical protein L1049_004331 [Liquidambar formosana]|uniref:IST1-like protein n=1 Tax=Liquidambar formosana TaxID=63359 RepID=A0AAP0RN48_LIQFO
MFDGLLGRKFYTKCKSWIKPTKVRIEVIKKKRNAMQKYLRNDIADLLRNGLDINAYGRAEGLLIELNRSSCYELIEQFCGCISNHLSVMDKQSECPEECREAVASLMYAAARFADLPELRDLRNIFTQRYGNSMEAFVNKEFVEKLKSRPPTKEMKLQLMQEIAQESSIEWDSKALEQKLFNPPPPRQDAGNKVSNVREYAVSRKNNEEDLSSYRQKSVADDEYKLHSSREKEDLLSRDRPGLTPGKDIHEATIDQYGQQNCSNSATSVSQEEADNRKPFYNRFVPPPYVKPKPGKYGTSLETPPADSDCNETPADTHHHHDSVDEADKPKPRSVRRRNLNQPPGRENVGNFENDGVAKINARGMRREDIRKGSQTSSTDDHDQIDEEERIMDGLLMHYSTKPSPYQPGQIKANLKPPSSLRTAADTGEATRDRSTDGKYPKSELVAPPARATSLPAEPTSPTKLAKGHPRATSSEMMNPAGHVHPKLPDYDDLAALFSSRKGR